jgi:hypothetical protein
MLRITIPDCQFLNEANMEFICVKGRELQLEHSLVSISKWESKWHRPYFSKKPKTLAEFRDYVRCMTLTQNVDPNVYLALTSDAMKKVSAYIENPMTATTFSNTRKGGSREVITAEIIYYWMIYYGIPFECQKWHLNRLLTLINVCEAKSQKPKKMPASEALAQRRALNASRKKTWNTRG